MKNTFKSLILTPAIVAALIVTSGQSRSATNTYTIPLKNEMSLELTADPFDPAKHRVTECDLSGFKGICLIDDKPVFGTDWTLPRSQLLKASVKIGTDLIDLDVSSMYNPWFEKPDPRDFNAESVYGGYRIRGFFSDAAGSYHAEWFIVQGKSVRTMLANAEQ
jgi:hypothetical protein